MSTQSPSLPNTLGSSTLETGRTTNFSSLSTSSPSFCESRLGAKAFAGQQRHGRKSLVLERRVVLCVSREEGLTHFRIAQERGTDVGLDFLEKDDVRLSRFLEDILEEVFVASDRKSAKGVDIPCDDRKRDVGDSPCSNWLCLTWLEALFGMGIHLRAERLQ